MKNWKDVQDAIYEALKKIWFDEPKAVTMSKMGVFPGGAGTGGQVLTNQLFLISDTQAMGWAVIEPAMYDMIKSDLYSLDQCKDMFRILTEGTCQLYGKYNPPHCPAPWFNMKEMWDFYLDIVDSYDSITNKEDFRDLIWIWECYVNRYHWWYWNVFPWELGLSRPKMTKEYIEKLCELSEPEL